MLRDDETRRSIPFAVLIASGVGRWTVEGRAGSNGWPIVVAAGSGTFVGDLPVTPLARELRVRWTTAVELTAHVTIDAD